MLVCQVFSSFVSSITNQMNQIRTWNSKNIELDAVLRHFLRSRKISTQLGVRITNFFKSLGAETELGRSLWNADVKIRSFLLPLKTRFKRFQIYHTPILPKPYHTLPVRQQSLPAPHAGSVKSRRRRLLWKVYLSWQVCQCLV